ncbi:MAG: Spy/CpxP family protein refolding chaperone [Candidatus Melainabacteria bacterium]|nr:Spy/CpxP family protein refolding chaperone [Candidatus Melainabacteria bacterium]
MKIWTTQLFSALVIASVVATSAFGLQPASACKKSMEPSKRCAINTMEQAKPCKIMQGWEDAVHLSADQKTQIDQIRLTHEPERDHLHTQIKEAKETLRRLMEANGNTPADESAVIAQVQAIGSLKTLAEVNHIKEAYQIKALLTPEQQKISTDYWHDMWQRKEKAEWGGANKGGNYKPSGTKQPCCGKKALWNRSSKTEQTKKGCPLTFKKQPKNTACAG